MQHKVIFLNNTPSHMAKPSLLMLKTLSWEVLPHAAYSPDLAPSEYYLFASMSHAHAGQRISSYDDFQKKTRRNVRGKRGKFLLAR